MNVLVLGGTRFLGLHLVELLHSQGHRISVLNRGQSQAKLPEDVCRIRADRSVPNQVLEALKGQQYEVVFDISGYRPPELLPVLEALDGRVGHYVFCSTVAVYAPGDIAPIRENHPLHRRPEAGDYSRDKILCEDLLFESFGRRGLRATAIRPPYIYGPHDHIRQRLFSVFARLKFGRKIIAPGEGKAMNHSAHVEDVASALAAVAGRAEAWGQAYNVAGPEAVTFNGYANMIASIVGVDAELVPVPVLDYELMLGELAPVSSAEIFDLAWRQSSVFSTEKLEHEIGWTPRYDIRHGLKTTYQWWIEQGLDKEPWDFSADDRALDWLDSNSRVLQ